MPIKNALRNPWFAAILLGLLAEALYCVGLTTPDQKMFDETHYVPAATMLLHLARSLNPEHPLVGKEFMALGMAIFGENALGWRFFSTVAGSATIMGAFAILQILYGRIRTSSVGALLVLLNFMVYIHSRIGMLDIFMVAFLTTGIAALMWSATSRNSDVMRRWLLGAVLMGLAVGSKWAAVPFLVYVGMAFLCARLRDAIAAGRHWTALFTMREGRFWSGMSAIVAIPLLGLVAVAVYFATFAPTFFYQFDPMTIDRLLPFQFHMYGLQTQVLKPHPYQSSWWSWVLDLRPIYYLYEDVDGAMRGVLMIGNPVVMWGGIVAALACVWTSAKTGLRRQMVPVGLWAGAFAPFAIIPKSIGFLYYYLPASVFLGLVIAASLHALRDTRLRHADLLVVAVAFGAFVFFFPILSAAALPDPQAFRTWMLLPSWA